MFDIDYVKNKKNNITTTLEGITKIQNYIPIYKNFFSLNDTNYNNIGIEAFMKPPNPKFWLFVDH